MSSLFDEIFSDISDEQKYENVNIMDEESIRTLEEASSLEEAMTSEIEKYHTLVSKIASIESLRGEISRDAGQLEYASAEEKLTKAVELSMDLVSSEEVGVSKAVLEKIDPKNHLLISTFSDEAINFVDSAVKVGKMIIKKIVDFILYLYRIIQKIVRKILGKSVNNVTVEVKKLSKEERSEKVLSLDYKRETNIDAQIKDFWMEDNDSDFDENDLKVSVKIPTDNGAALWDYEKNKLISSGKELISVISKVKGQLLDTTRSSFIGLADCASNEYYGLLSMVFLDDDSLADSKAKRDIESKHGAEKVTALEKNINELFCSKVEVPRSIDGKIIYPGVVFKKPNPKKEMDVLNTISSSNKNKVKIAKNIEGKSFDIDGVDQLISVMKTVFKLIDDLSDVSDECERRVTTAQKKLEFITETASSQKGIENFSRFFQSAGKFRSKSPAEIVNIYNSSVLGVLKKLAQEQLNIAIAVGNLSNGIGDASPKPGIIKQCIDKFASQGVDIKIS